MRTTITIDDHLLDELKIRAARLGTTVSRLIEEAVRTSLRPEGDGQKTDFHVITYGGTGRFTEMDLNKTSRLTEFDDAARFAEH
ncbi:MAG: ribbon-helix-helix protein, CopG family [Vulcanimicrobiota bacterium]